MFDIETLRFALGLLSLLVLVLFYIGVYRPTRSAFAGWWSIALFCTTASSALLLLNGTTAQVIANPTSNLVAAAGSGCVWFATQSIRNLRKTRWVIVIPAVVVGLASLFDDPATNNWAGNGLLFTVMGTFFTLASWDMWRAWLARRSSADWQHDGEARVALLVNALASAVIAGFYVARAALFATIGHENPFFVATVGGAPAAVILLVTLMAVTFSAAALGFDQQTLELRRRVALDDLTGLLARSAFFERVAAAIETPCSSGHDRLLVVADLDHFKSINDEYGHAAGDRALEVFAASVNTSLNDGELAGRLGGEEFAMLMCSTAPEEVTGRLEKLGAEYSARGSRESITVPTVSFGVACATPGVSVDRSLANADAAMYQAKEAGRNRVILALTDDELTTRHD